MKPEQIQEVFSRLAGRNRKRRPPKLEPRVQSHIEKRNAKAIEIHPEPRGVLLAIARKIDKEPNKTKAWEFVDDVLQTGVLTKPPEWDTILKTTAKNLHRVTISYFTKYGQATGVLVNIAGRNFIATTAHSVLKRQRELFIVGFKIKNIKEPSRILSVGRSDSKAIDVAYLEVDADLPDRIGKSAIDLDRIEICGHGRTENLTMVCGFPNELITDRRCPDESIDRIMQAQVWPYLILDPSNWGELPPGIEREPDPSIDVFMGYPQDEQFQSLVAQRGTGFLADPRGMSGGGFWIATKPKTAVWSPDSYKLFAIQSTWWDFGRYLQAVQIIHWLTLLWRGQPKLRSIISYAFPDVNFERLPTQFATPRSAVTGDAQ